MQGQLVNLFVGDPDSMTLNNKAKHGWWQISTASTVDITNTTFHHCSYTWQAWLSLAMQLTIWNRNDTDMIWRSAAQSFSYSKLLLQQNSCLSDHWLYYERYICERRLSWAEFGYGSSLSANKITLHRFIILPGLVAVVGCNHMWQYISHTSNLLLFSSAFALL